MAGSIPASATAELTRDAFARTAALALVLLTLAAVLGPVIAPHDAATIDLANPAAAPGSLPGHWWGTDQLGRDVFVRTMQGLRVSLLIGVAAAAISVTFGLVYGGFAGYVGGRLGAVMMRAVDVLYALPYVFIVIILASLFGRGDVGVLLLAIASVGWLTTARIVAGEARALRERPFVEAARAMGAPTHSILAWHILPNVLPPLIAYAMLTVPQVVLYESFLSFLGLGVQEPLASLGNLVSEGAREMQTAPWLLIAPAACLVLTVLALNVLGDRLRDVLDPHHHA